MPPLSSVGAFNLLFVWQLLKGQYLCKADRGKRRVLAPLLKTIGALMAIEFFLPIGIEVPLLFFDSVSQITRLAGNLNFHRYHWLLRCATTESNTKNQ